MKGLQLVVCDLCGYEKKLPKFRHSRDLFSDRHESINESPGAHPELCAMVQARFTTVTPP
jgi:hypothetical protein